jgi:predicted negative regulator of RcsB-dependent stress response
MAEQSAFDRRNIEPPPVARSSGLLDQFNLPPAVISFLYRYQRTIWMVLAGIVITGVSIAGYSSYRDQIASRALSAYDAAQRAGAENRPLLEQVVQQYGTTPSGLWARIDLALLDERAGNLEAAIAQFETINARLSTKSPLKPLILSKLGVLYENTDNANAALDVYGALTKQTGFEAEAHRALGRVHEQKGNLSEAAAMYEQFMAMTADGQGNNDPVREMIEFRFNQLKRQ